MHVVDDQQHRRPDHQCPDQSPLTRLAFPSQAVHRVKEARIGGDHGDSLEEDDGVGTVVEAAMEVDDERVDEAGGVREEELEEGEEGRVIEGPGAGLVGVPAGEGEGVGEGEPVAVDLEVGALVGGHQEELEAGGDGHVPPELGDGRRRRGIRHGGGELVDRRRQSRSSLVRRRSSSWSGSLENGQTKTWIFFLNFY